MTPQRSDQAGSEVIIGILGGLGPWATLDFFEKILRVTPASRDQDHFRVLIDNNPKIPDRTPAILGHGEDPTPALVATARNLEKGGASFLVIPCNTAHAFYEPIQSSVDIPVLHIMEEVAVAARAEIPGLRKVGILATIGTIRAQLYHRAFAQQGVTVLVPPQSDQAIVDHAIYEQVKAGEMDDAVTKPLVGVANGLIAAGAEALVLGCTELPFVLKASHVRVPLLDSNLVLARAAVRTAMAPPPVRSRP